MEGLVRSAYSTSASASAVTSTMHQWTGRLRRYRAPLRAMMASWRTVSASVRIVPTAENAQALELAPLDLDLLLGESAAGAAEVARAHLPLLRPELLVDLPLDGEAVAVPARNVVGELAAHRGAFHDHVFQHLVEEVAQVQRPVRVRWTVVEHEQLPPCVLAQDLLVDLSLEPRLHLRRLAFGELRAHRKRGLRQVDGVLEVHRESPGK